jgi:hypothetical protein
MDRTQVLTPEERAEFKRCRRAWDLGAGTRRGLEPIDWPERIEADRLMRDALAVYYFPGMWDWSRSVVLPLVMQSLEKGLEGTRDRLPSRRLADFEAEAAALRRLLRAYFEWAPGLEQLSPVLVEVDCEADLIDPDEAETALRTLGGAAVRYRGRVDLLAIDEHDAYWVVQHRVVERWTPLEHLLRDENVMAACWTWERFYLGMRIAGTIHNELRVPADFEAEAGMAGPPTSGETTGRRGLRQSEGSGGGRSIGQHRRLYAQSREPLEPERVVRDLAGWFRRTWIRRSPDEISRAGQQLAIEARLMLDPAAATYPSPSDEACPACRFRAPCEALYAGEDAEAILGEQYRHRSEVAPVQGRLGGVTWSTGRGAAPPRFPSDLG